MKKWQRGEIATAITIGTLIILGVSSLVSSVFLNKNKQTTKTRAAEACSEEGAWKTSCLEPRERQSCADNAGVALVSRCEGGEWKAQNPECQTQCSPGAQSKGDEWKECNPGEILDQCVRKDCDGSRNELVCIEKYCDSSGNIREKSGSPTGQKCEEREDFKSGQQRNCAVGSIVNYCVKKECDTAIGKMVCYESYYDETCELKTRIGSETNTRCGRTEGLQRPPPPPPPTATPWPKNPPLPPSAKKQSENNSVSSNCNYNGKAISNGNIVCAGIGYYYCNNGTLVGDGIDERNVPIPYSCGSGKRCSYDVGKEKDQCLDVKSDTGAGQSSEDEQIISTGGGGPEGPQVKYYTEACQKYESGTALFGLGGSFKSGVKYVKEERSTVDRQLLAKKCKIQGQDDLSGTTYSSSNCGNPATCWITSSIPGNTTSNQTKTKFPAGQVCLGNDDCESNLCLNGQCTDPIREEAAKITVNVTVNAIECGEKWYPVGATVYSQSKTQLGETMKAQGPIGITYKASTSFNYTGPMTIYVEGVFKPKYKSELPYVKNIDFLTSAANIDQNNQNPSVQITKDCR